MNTILIVEDEESISELIRIALSKCGYRCIQAFDGEKAIELAETTSPDLILLDIMLPKIDGLEVLNYLKELEISVIFLTAKSELKDKIAGLKLGADDYITKPFEIAELKARVEAVLRRNNRISRDLQCGDIRVDSKRHMVYKNGEPVDLTLKEYDLLLFLLKNRNIALSREQIYERVWNDPYIGSSRTVDLHIQRLRKKLGWKDQIQSVFKVGYLLAD